VNRSVVSLLLVLVIQCGIIAAVYWPQHGLMQQSVAHGLLTLDPTRIDQIRVEDEYNNETLLVKTGEQWLLPELENLPADPVKVAALLASMTAQNNTWPIAQTTTARQRFQVADYRFQRSVALGGAGKELATVYLGTSPGFRKVHARQKGTDAIYSISFNVFDAPGLSGAWVEPRLLQIRAPMQIVADSYSLHREGEHWIAGTGGAPEARELDALLSALRALQVDGVANADLQRELAGAVADLFLLFQSLTGQTTLELFTLDDRYFISSSEYPLFFTVSAYDFDRLTGIDFTLMSDGAAVD
jgi:hypothetical protein